MRQRPLQKIEPIRAAQYLRVSTERQDLSIDVQAEVIAHYARQRGFEVTRTYEDAGRSGLTITTRPGLQQLIADVIGGEADFTAILVYDVSRWGRFQDIDESAHYEFLCRQLGINVHYCAELFANDGSSLSSLLKSMKRVMAAEFSRELSTRVRLSQERLASRGFWVNGSVPYGYARMIVDRYGEPKGIILDDGESKNVKNDRIMLVPGPPEQVANVRRIFDLYVREGLGRRGITRRLNAAGQVTRGKRPWREGSILQILKNEVYIGNIVWGREHNWLGRRQNITPPETWIRVPNAFEGIVEPAVFHLAQDLIAHRNVARDLPKDQLLSRLRALMERNGELARSLLYAEPDILHSPAYRARFGTMRRAFHELGYADLPRRLRRAPRREKNLRWRVIDRLIVGLRARHDGRTRRKLSSHRHRHSVQIGCRPHADQPGASYPRCLAAIALQRRRRPRHSRMVLARRTGGLLPRGGPGTVTARFAAAHRRSAACHKSSSTSRSQRVLRMVDQGAAN